MTSDANAARPAGQQLQGLFTLYSQGRLDDALELADGLLRDYPREALLFSLRGIVQVARGDYEDAIRGFRQALEVNPDVADTHYYLGTALMEASAFVDAAESFSRAIRLRPDYVEAHSKLCQSLERGGRIDAMADALAEARRHCPVDHPALRVRDAELLRRRGDDAAARQVLESGDWSHADPETRETRAYLLADACDRLGECEAAFACAQEANALCPARAAAEIPRGAAYLRLIEELTAAFTPESISGWEHAEIVDGRRDPVFIVGFPRSGTTLLDTVLHGHSGIAVVEEMPAAYRLEVALRRATGSYAGGLAKLDTETIGRLRDVYFDELYRHVAEERRDSVIVDKLPLNLVHAGMLHRVFPRARFLFSLRHPCDAVLGCFLRSLKPNAGMVLTLELRDTARLYDRVMTLWERYRAVLPLDVHEVRYEALVVDFERTITGALAHIGLDWEAGLQDFADRAQQRGTISTPSYNQVTQPIYSHASGRWLRYRMQLEPVLPVLAPWIDRFGYGHGDPVA